MKRCKVPGCEKWDGKGGMGYCGMHYARVRRYGNPDYVTPENIRRERSRNSQPTLGQCKPNTYKKYRGRHMHRVIAEAMLGRPLESWEHVHHKDGNKHNNNPENLVVLSRAEHGKETAKQTDNVKNLLPYTTGRKGMRPLRGAKLSDDQVRAIRNMEGTESVIAAIFGISRSLVGYIKRRKAYAYVA